MPTFQDNLDGTDALTVTVTPDGLTSPHRFEIGSVVIMYNVTDRAGRSSICFFKVIVLGKRTRPTYSRFFWFPFRNWAGIYTRR